MTQPFDLNKPSHLIANDVLRQLEILMSGSGLHVTFGVKAHDLIEGLVAQYQDKLLEAHNRSRDNMLAESQQQAKDDAAIAQRIETQLSTAGFPAIEDVYVSTNYSAYVTFEREPSDKHIKFAQNAFGLEIVRSDPRLRNRYRVTFKSPDREEA